MLRVAIACVLIGVVLGGGWCESPTAIIGYDGDWTEKNVELRGTSVLGVLDGRLAVRGWEADVLSKYGLNRAAVSSTMTGKYKMWHGFVVATADVTVMVHVGIFGGTSGQASYSSFCQVAGYARERAFDYSEQGLGELSGYTAAVADGKSFFYKGSAVRCTIDLSPDGTRYVVSARIGDRAETTFTVKKGRTMTTATPLMSDGLYWHISTKGVGWAVEGAPVFRNKPTASSQAETYDLSNAVAIMVRGDGVWPSKRLAPGSPISTWSWATAIGVAVLESSSAAAAAVDTIGTVVPFGFSYQYNSGDARTAIDAVLTVGETQFKLGAAIPMSPSGPIDGAPTTTTRYVSAPKTLPAIGSAYGQSVVSALDLSIVTDASTTFRKKKLFVDITQERHFGSLAVPESSFSVTDLATGAISTYRILSARTYSESFCGASW